MSLAPPRSLLRAAAIAFATIARVAAQASAGSPVVQLDPLTVTEHPSGADERTASVWVVTPDPQAAPPVNIDDLLLGVPGVHLDQPGGPGGRSTLFLRGGEENYALIFLDGVPLNDPTNSRGGGVDFSLLEPALLRRVAVVRGPASVRYGPEALAGVLHFSTEGTPADEIQLATEAGGDDFRRGGGVFGHVWGGGSSSVQLSAAATDDGSLGEGSRAQRRSAHVAFATAAGRIRTRAFLWHTTHNADSFPDDSGGERLAVIRALARREDKQTVAGLRLEGKLGKGVWTASTDAAQFDATTHSPAVAPAASNPAGLPAMEDDTRLRRFRASLWFEQMAGPWTLTGGADAQHEAGRDHGALQFGPINIPDSFSANRTRAGVFAEASGRVGEIAIVAGARGDRYNDGLTRSTLRAGLLGPSKTDTQWRVNVGNGFKPPSFYSLSNPLVGNPNLRPEHAETLDAGVRQKLGQGLGLLDLSVFSSRFRDGIDFDPGPPPRLVNRAEIRSRGAEAALVLRPVKKLSITGSVSYANSRNEPGDVRTNLRPQWRGGLSTLWALHRGFSISAALTSVGNVPDTSIPTGGVLLGGWTRIDLAVVGRVHAGWEVTLGLDNALDRRYEEAVGFPSPGRRLRAGLRARF